MSYRQNDTQQPSVSLGDFINTIGHFKSTDLQSLQEYKYTVDDRSMVQKYILNPFILEPILKILPTWIAPNTITLSGFVFFVFAFIAAYLSPYLGRFTHLTVGVCIFIYLCADCLDGKQARKTESSSALGEFFDHAIDALCTGLLIIIASIEFSFTPEQSSVVFFAAGFLFYLPHWEHRQKGTLVLNAWLNPVEFLFLYSIWEVIRTVFNLHLTWFKDTIIFGVSFVWIGIGAMLLIVLADFLYTVFIVGKHIRENNQSWVPALKQLATFTGVAAICALYAYSTETYLKTLVMLGAAFVMAHYIQWYIVSRLLKFDPPTLSYIHFAMFVLACFLWADYTTFSTSRTGHFVFQAVWIILMLIVAGIVELSLFVEVFYRFSVYLHIHPFKVKRRTEL